MTVELTVEPGMCLHCRGHGCDVCEGQGVCPGCGRPWDPRPSPLSLVECAVMGVLPVMCRCGKHQRRRQGAVALEVIDGDLGDPRGRADCREAHHSPYLDDE